MPCRVDTYRVTLSFACFSIDVNEWGLIVRAAPIARWALGKNLEDFKRWEAIKRGKVELLIKDTEEKGCPASTKRS